MNTRLLITTAVAFYMFLACANLVRAFDTTGKVRVGSVWVNDFTSSSIFTNSDGDVLIDDKHTYQLVFIRSNTSFLISILDKDFFGIKPGAEEALMKRLDISRPAACKLPISVTTLHSINPDQANIIHYLPFCALQTLADVNGDCNINKNDVQNVKSQYFYDGFDVNEDVNGDGFVNALDISVVIQYLGFKDVCGSTK